MDASNLAGLVESLEDIRDSTPAQHAAARRLLLATAPDLLEVVTGEKPTTPELIAGLKATSAADDAERWKRLLGGRHG